MRPTSTTRLRIRQLGAIVALLTVANLLATPPAFASVTMGVPREPSRALVAAPPSRQTLSQAPMALQAAVRATLGPQSTIAGPSQQAELTAPDASSFGGPVSISASTALVAGVTNTGTQAVYVFVASGGTWAQQAELTASDGGANDFFGFALAISGSTAVVGAYGKRGYTGTAYVFVRSGTTWTQQAELIASDGAENDFFGAAVAISGPAVLVGAPSRHAGAGAAYVFVRSGTTWTQQAELTPADGVRGNWFGGSVALSGAT